MSPEVREGSGGYPKVRKGSELHYGIPGGDGRVHRKSGRGREWLGRLHGSKGGVGRPPGSPVVVRRAPRKSRRGREGDPEV